MERLRLKRPFYFPGIISLIFLPLLFSYYGERGIKALNQGVTVVNWYNPALPEKYPEMFTGTFPPVRNYIDIVLTGEGEKDQIKLDFSQVRLRELLSSNDSTTGIHYQFNDSSSYWAFVKALNICLIEKAKSYMPYDNNLWVYHFPPDTSIKTWVCGSSASHIQTKASWRTEVANLVRLVFKTSGILIVAFLILLSLGVQRIRKGLNST